MDKRRPSGTGLLLYYKERYNFLEAKKYYVLVAPSGNDMETYMESMSKKVNLYFQNILSQYSIKMSRKNRKECLHNKKRE